MKRIDPEFDEADFLEGAKDAYHIGAPLSRLMHVLIQRCSCHLAHAARLSLRVFPPAVTRLWSEGDFDAMRPMVSRVLLDALRCGSPGVPMCLQPLTARWCRVHAPWDMWSSPAVA